MIDGVRRRLFQKKSVFCEVLSWRPDFLGLVEGRKSILPGKEVRGMKT
jgi:hypothetical protein